MGDKTPHLSETVTPTLRSNEAIVAAEAVYVDERDDEKAWSDLLLAVFRVGWTQGYRDTQNMLRRATEVIRGDQGS